MSNIIPMDLERFDRDRLRRKSKRNDRRRSEKKYREKYDREDGRILYYVDLKGGDAV